MAESSLPNIPGDGQDGPSRSPRIQQRQSGRPPSGRPPMGSPPPIVVNVENRGPNCGQMVLIVIIALIAVIGGCAYCTVKPVADLAVTVDEAIESIDEVIGGIDEALDEPKKKSTPTPAQPAQPANLVPDVTVSSVELSKAYSDDRIAAEYEYEGKLAEIIGKVIGKEKKAGLYEISLVGATGDVVCKMEAYDIEKAAKAKKGHLINVRGVIIGVPGFSNVVVQPCTIWDGK